ncbi:MAG TPA: SMP-30/gluconolactonase/LRE family protein [Terriglobales bacterium]|nr:SMP-30/gluconolactonase/LRE family protein [Terriglobales bacterium]
MDPHRQRVVFRAVIALLSAGVLFWPAACARKPDWAAKNERIIAEQKIAVRTRADIPAVRLKPGLADGVVTPVASLPETPLAPGVKACLYWGKGNLVAWLTFDAGAALPEETLPAERIMVVMKGEVRQLLGGDQAEMRAVPRETPDGTHGGTPRNDFVYLEKGSRNGVQAGPAGAEIVEVYWPPRADYLAKAGAKDVPAEFPQAAFPIAPTVRPGAVGDLNGLQLTELQPGAESRLIGGHGAQLSFLRMSPGLSFATHLHPEEQVMIVLRGSIDELIMDGTTMMKKGDLLYLPATMVHGGKVGDAGCDVLDVFFPPRPDYEAKRQAREAAFHAIIPADAKLELLVDGAKQGPGLIFTEGPKWLGGKLYFSSMAFDQAWKGDPKKSVTVEMAPDGTYRYIQRGILTNGLMPLANGNLAACDMFGHRLVEMTTSGRVVRTLASRYGGKPIDGPNDVVVDRRGGLYFTDPQFTPEAKKFQPGRSVFYLTPEGKLVRVIEPDVFAMPNGLVLTPDGKTLLVNNTYDSETFWNVRTDKANFIWAYDVHPDGTLSGLRKFCELRLTPEVLERRGRSTSADGMTIDARGDLFVATYLGLQIFDARGEFVGVVNTPVFPVSCCFGGDDMKTLYMMAYNKVYSILTNVTGFRYPPK